MSNLFKNNNNYFIVRMMVLMLNINMEYNSGILFVRLIGSLNKLTLHVINDTLIPIVKNNGIKNLVYNFDNLMSIDDEGFKSLLDCYNEIINNSGDVLVVNNKFKLCFFKEIDNELSALNILKI